MRNARANFIEFHFAHGDRGPVFIRPELVTMFYEQAPDGKGPIVSGEELRKVTILFLDSQHSQVQTAVVSETIAEVALLLAPIVQ